MKLVKKLSENYATANIVDLSTVDEESYPQDLSWRDLHQYVSKAHEQGFLAGLRLAAKEAKTIDIWDGNTGSEYCSTEVDRDSILDIKDIEAS